MNGRRILFWIVCMALMSWSLPSTAAHLTYPDEQVEVSDDPSLVTASGGFGGPVVNPDPCRWTDEGFEHDLGVKRTSLCGTLGGPPAPLNDDHHDGVSGVYLSEPDTFFVGVGACADHLVDGLTAGGDVGCDLSQLFPQNAPEPLFWDLDGDDCYNTINQGADGLPLLAQQERKGSGGCSGKKAAGREAVNLDPTVFPSGFVGAGATLCDLEVGDGGGTDETVIDDQPNPDPALTSDQVSDGTWDDGGIGGACHTGTGFYRDSGWNSPGCAGEGPTKSDNIVAHAEDWTSGDSVWISAACSYVAETGGSPRVLSTALELVDNHLGSSSNSPVAGLANDTQRVTGFLHDVDDRGAKCFYDDSRGAGLFENNVVVSALGERFTVPSPNHGQGDPGGPYTPAMGDAVPPADQKPMVNCALQTLTGGAAGISCSQDPVADVANYGHGGGHSVYPRTPDDLRSTKGEFHLNHLRDAESHPAKNPSGPTAPVPAGGATVFEEVDGGVAYPDDPTPCHEEANAAPVAAVFVHGTAAFTEGTWSETGDEFFDPPVNLHPTGVIPASGGWIDSTPNFGDATDDHAHCDEDGHYEGGIQSQSTGGANQDDHENGGCS